MNLRTRPARVAAAVGAVLAACTTTALALTAGTASADEPGRCTENVNVREDPEADAKIVALCEAGKEVKLGEERDGFVRIDELNGWAAKDFVKADESSSSSSSGDHDGDDEGDRDADDADRGTHTETGRTSSDDAANRGDRVADAPGTGGVGGLLG